MRAFFVCLSLFSAGCMGAPDDPTASPAAPDASVAPAGGAADAPAMPIGAGAGAGDAVVIAVVDLSGFSPYLHDFYGPLMPQHLDADPANDLPLDASPAEWLSGLDPSAFASFEALPLTLSADPDADPSALAKR